MSENELSNELSLECQDILKLADASLDESINYIEINVFFNSTPNVYSSRISTKFLQLIILQGLVDAVSVDIAEYLSKHIQDIANET